MTLMDSQLTTMLVLMVASTVAWGREGNEQLSQNWSIGQKSCSSSGCIVRQVFYGVCIGMLGLTGFECLFATGYISGIILLTRPLLGIPSYAASIKAGRFPAVLRNLHYPAIILNTMMMLFVIALIPLETVLTGANVLSILAETVSSRF
jgi:hypothetical protein